MQNIFFIISFILSQLVSVYTISVTDSTGNVIPLSSFEGKKILIVNTASNSADVAQYAKLEQLYQLHKDSLVIIAFPSNDFGNEPGTNAVIDSTVRSNFNIHYVLASKSNVSGVNPSSLYNWIGDSTANGMMNGKVKKDFYKFLINSEGKLIGIFTNKVDPLDIELQSAITN